MNKKRFLAIIVIGVFMLTAVTATFIPFPNTIWDKLIRTGSNPSSDAIETTFNFEENVNYCLAVHNCGLSGMGLKIENSEDSTILVKEKFHFKNMKEGHIPTIITGKLNPGGYKVTLTPYGGKDKYTNIYMPFKAGVSGCGLASICY